MDCLLSKLQMAEVECLQKEETISRTEHEGCTMQTLGLIASHFLTEVADADSLPLRMFEVCDWDNDGYHNFEEAVRFAAITSGGPLDKESWLTICQEVNAEPELGLRFSDYAKLMDQDLDQVDVDHAFTARQHTERGRGLFGDTTTRVRAYDDMHVRSAPTGTLFEQETTMATTRSMSSSSRLSSNITRKSVSVKDAVVGAILAEVGNVTDLTGVVSPKKRRRSRRKKSKSSSSISSKTNGSIHISELSSVTSAVNELSLTESVPPPPVETKPRRTTKGLRTTRLKTIICRNWEAGNCQYGAECGFAHGDMEVKPAVQPACKHWAANGACERGTACAFSHASPVVNTI